MLQTGINRDCSRDPSVQLLLFFTAEAAEEDSLPPPSSSSLFSPVEAEAEYPTLARRLALLLLPASVSLLLLLFLPLPLLLRSRKRLRELSGREGRVVGGPGDVFRREHRNEAETTVDRFLFFTSLFFSLCAFSLEQRGEEGARLLTASCLALSISLRSQQQQQQQQQQQRHHGTLWRRSLDVCGLVVVVVERRCDRPHCRVPAPGCRGQGRPGKRGDIFLVLRLCIPVVSFEGDKERERERANRREREREERKRKARMVIFFSIDGLSTFVSPFSLDSTSSPCPLCPSILSTHRTRRVCLTREVRSGGRADFRAGKKEEENSKTAASPFFSSSFLSFNLHLSLPPLASFGTAPSFAPSSITSSSANPFSAASSTATAQSDFARRAAAVGAGIHTTSERLKALGVCR